MKHIGPRQLGWATIGITLTAATISLAAIAHASAGASTSTAALVGNACSNPVLASGLNGWGPLDGASTSRDAVGDLPGASWAFDTAGHSFYMPQLSVAAGQQWTFTTEDRVLGATGTAKIGVDWYNSSGQFLNEWVGTAVPIPMSTLSGGTWTRIGATFTVPASAATAHVLQFGDFGSATATAFKATECDYEQTDPNTMASVRYNWGSPNAAESDEYNGTSVDLSKWGLFGAGAGQSTGCTAGFQGNGQRCASQTTEGGGYLSVTATAGGVTGGLWSRTVPFKYGRVEVRERAVPTSDNGGREYHAVPLLWPQNDADYTHAEIDFAERDVAAPSVDLFVHHDGTQSHCSVTIDSTQFHNYAVDWEPTSVTWYVDGTQVCTINASINYFDHTNGGAQMDMLSPTGTAMRPAREDVDWIRTRLDRHVRTKPVPNSPASSHIRRSAIRDRGASSAGPRAMSKAPTYGASMASGGRAYVRASGGAGRHDMENRGVEFRRSCDGALADNPIRPGQAACSYSCRVLPRRSCLRMSRGMIWSGSVSRVGSGCSGRALPRLWWGLWSL